MMLVNSSLVRAQNGDNQGNEYESKIQLGFAIAPVPPVPLNLVGKDRALD
jgi:hypothetical protein